MAKFTTDFLTWLKGIFYTETEVDTLLDKKINTVDVQGKITSFTNKDRINNERLTRYITTTGNPYLCFHDGTPSFEGLTKIGITDTTTETVYISGITGIGSNVTCTVKKVDGTVLGTATWDSTNSRYNYTFDGTILGVGIYYVYAEVTVSGSVWKSNILSVFVKDTNNLLTFNQWSGSEYEKEKTGFDVESSEHTSLIHTNEWSSIGENSLKVIKLQETSWVRINYRNSIYSKTITVKLDINTKSPIKIFLYEFSDVTNLNHVSTIIPKNTCTNTTLSLVTTSENVRFVVQVVNNGNINSSCYLDNINFISSQ